jgi:hypothetical protein
MHCRNGDIALSFLPAPIVGHVGDGNFRWAFVICIDLFSHFLDRSSPAALVFLFTQPL